MSRELHEWTGESKNRDFGGSRLSDRAAPSRVLYFGRFRPGFWVPGCAGPVLRSSGSE